MATYSRFEELPVWNAAIDLAVELFRLTESTSFARQGDLRSQLRRAALSISNNIAEGFERGTRSELISFVYIARGSAGEVRSMLQFCDRHGGFTSHTRQLHDLRAKVESCSRQLRAWADHLQNSPIRGDRHVTNESRERHQRSQRADAFMQHVNEVADRARIEREKRQHGGDGDEATQG